MTYLLQRFVIIGIILLTAGCASNELGPSSKQENIPIQPYFANIEVIKTDTSDQQNITGIVFHDSNGNGKLDQNENGVRNVAVSNGRDVVRTDNNGNYRLEVLNDMSLFVVQPTGWRVPTDSDYVPQFAYEHKPLGSPKAFRYGGMPPTGSIPSAVNFPLKKSPIEDFNCAILGDTQVYANQDISYFRDSVIDNILDQNIKPECVIAVGDVMGDDLDLIPRMANVISALKVPQWWTHGNHDFDFDADFDKDSADSWRSLWGPAYYAFEIGNVLFISLDNVVYPCGPEDAKLDGREYCITSKNKRYNGRITDNQIEFVRQLINSTEENKTIVFSHHIPFVSFVDQTTAAHQTDNVKQLYDMVEGRNVLSISGHTHTIENLSPGDSFKGWKDVLQIEELPFRHIIAGAASGSWFQGDFDIHGTPMSLQRMGAPKGWLELEFDPNGNFIETYHGANTGENRVAWLSISTPEFRDWFTSITQWRRQDADTRDPIPPLSINDLPDVKLLTQDSLDNKSFITANVWAGSTDTQVTVSINSGPALAMIRTQEARGEEARIGVDYVDPFAAQRQLSVSRMAIQSHSGEPKNQGYQIFKGSQVGPGIPQPQRTIANRNMHLWVYELPANLPEGTHVAKVEIVDRHGRKTMDNIVFEVRSERPDMRFRIDKWQSFENGPPINR